MNLVHNFAQLQLLCGKQGHHLVPLEAKDDHRVFVRALSYVPCASAAEHHEATPIRTKRRQATAG
eukprot:scaffold62061_cov18-Tisochrysis_lutea.AAC.1